MRIRQLHLLIAISFGANFIFAHDFSEEDFSPNEEQAISVLEQFYFTYGDGKDSKQRVRRNFSPEVTKILKEWYQQHSLFPYPSEEEKAELSAQCDITLKQVNTWFINHRRRTVIRNDVKNENLRK